MAQSAGASSEEARKQCQRRRHTPPLRRCLVVSASQVKELPIFPLGVVAFPACQTPLHVFEARYRVLFNTLLAGEQGLEEDLIQREAKHVGTKQFGMCYASQKGMASVGTILKISRHVRFEDGRLYVDNTGTERFRVLKVLHQRPVLTCLVEILDEDDDSHAECDDLAQEVRQGFKDLLYLNAKSKNREPTPVPDEIDAWQPRNLSFYIASLFHESPMHQQVMLEENSTRKRLETQKVLLTGSVGYMRARIALEGAFAAPEAAQDKSETSQAPAQEDASPDNEGSDKGPEGLNPPPNADSSS